eukprot:6723732-Prymnesium_polylepis.1
MLHRSNRYMSTCTAVRGTSDAQPICCTPSIWKHSIYQRLVITGTCRSPPHPPRSPHPNAPSPHTAFVAGSTGCHMRPAAAACLRPAARALAAPTASQSHEHVAVRLTPITLQPPSESAERSFRDRDALKNMASSVVFGSPPTLNTSWATLMRCSSSRASFLITTSNS